MKYYLAALWIINIVIFLRASLQAQGKIKKKLFAKDSFLLWQEVIAIFSFAQAVLAFIVKENVFAYAGLANIILDFLFYLQPTPRTTKKITLLFIILNLILILLYFLG